MWLEDHFGNGSILQRNERVKLAASFWNNTGAGMVIGGMTAHLRTTNVIESSFASLRRDSVQTDEGAGLHPPRTSPLVI